MYRAYQPTLPTTNLYLQEKWDRSRYTVHRRKVLMATPAVDTKGPQTPGHLLVNMKRIQMDKDRWALVEKQNHMHAAKLSAIRQSHGQLDNWICYTQRSLNAGQRQQNLGQITQENSKMLERILKRDSEYGRWRTDWEKVQQIQTNISRYPRPAVHVGVGLQRVTFCEVKKNSDVPCLPAVMKDSETNRNQSRSTIKLESISGIAGPGISKADKRSLVQKHKCSPDSQKTSSDSEDNTEDILNGTKQESGLSQGEHGKKAGQSVKHTDGVRSLSQRDMGRGTSVLYEEPEQIYGFSPTESDVKSSYSFEDSRESVPPTPIKSDSISSDTSTQSLSVKPGTFSTDLSREGIPESSNEATESSTDSLPHLGSIYLTTRMTKRNQKQTGGKASPPCLSQGSKQSPYFSSQNTNTWDQNVPRNMFAMDQ